MSQGRSHIPAGVVGASFKQSVSYSAAKTGNLTTVRNDEGADLIVVRNLIHIKTGSTAACTLDSGVGAVTGTAYDNLIDGRDVNVVAEGVYDNIDDQGTNGEAKHIWKAGHYWNVNVASGDANGLVADFYLHVQPLTGGF